LCIKIKKDIFFRKEKCQEPYNKTSLFSRYDVTQRKVAATKFFFIISNNKNTTKTEYTSTMALINTGK